MKKLLILLLLIPSALHAQGSLLPDTLQQFTDSLGVPLASGFVCTTLSGTSTNLATYPTQADANAQTNPNVIPVQLDSAGRGTIWLGTGTYRIAVYAAVSLGISGTCNGTNVGPLIKTVDGVAGFGSLLITNNTWTGTNAFTGSVTIGGVPTTGDVVVNCAAQSGATAGAKIAACIAALPSTGGTADARGIQGSQTIAANFFSGVTKKGHLILGAASYSASVCLTVPNTWEISGDALQTSITFTNGCTGAAFGPVSDPPVGISIHDLTILGGGNVAYGIDLHTTMVGSDCTDHIGPNLDIEGTTTAAVRFDNCGGADTWISRSKFQNITSGVCVQWSNTGGNTLIDHLACGSAGGDFNTNRFGAIKASGQMVSVTSSSFQGFVSADTNFPVLYLAGDYIYPGAGNAGVITSTAASSSSYISNVIFEGGLSTGFTSGDSVMDGHYGVIEFHSFLVTNATTVANVFGSNIGKTNSGLPMFIDGTGLNSVAGSNSLTVNYPAVTVANVRQGGVDIVGNRNTFYQGVLATGANPVSTNTNAIEQHNVGTDSTVDIFNDSAGALASHYRLDATQTQGLAISNVINGAGTITVNPGVGGTFGTAQGDVSIGGTGTLSIGGTLMTLGGASFTTGNGVPSGSCINGVPGLYVRQDPVSASTALYLCTAPSTWTAITVP